MLKYEEILFRSGGHSRFIVSINSIKEGWITVREIPKTTDISTISMVDPNSLYKISEINYKEYENKITPDLPSKVNVMHEGVIYSGILLSRSGNYLTLYVDNKLTEISNPFIIYYDKCSNENCELYFSAVDLLFKRNINEFNIPTSNSIIKSKAQIINKKLLTSNGNTISSASIINGKNNQITFKARGLSWDATYKMFLNFNKNIIEDLSGDIICKNSTELDYNNIKAKFMSSSDEYNNRKSRSFMASQSMSASQDVMSEQTVTGSSIYTLKNLINVPKESTSRYNLINLKNIPMFVTLEYNILMKKDHPETIIKFKIPEDIIDGMPSGTVEFWEDKTFLKETYMPISSPSEELSLNLGLNSFVKIKTSIQRTKLKDIIIKDEDGFEHQISKILYKVESSISNNSVHSINIIPFHELNGNVDKFESVNDADIKIDSSGNKRLEFIVQKIKQKETIILSYSLIN